MEHIPLTELKNRQSQCLELLDRLRPDAGGLMIFNRLNIYYFTGTMGAGVYWLPKTGSPLLMVRKGSERALFDNPGLAVATYRSFSDLPVLASEHGSPLTPVIAAEQSALPWSLAENLQRRLPQTNFINADQVLTRLRAVKSPWELGKMRNAGALHAKAAEELLPQRISPGMTELKVAHATSKVFYSLGGCGLTRLNAFGEELLLGEVSVGDNGNFPTFYNGPLGCRGAHPAAPFLGCPETVWRDGQLLVLDAGFCFEGYNSDKTVCYFAGIRSEIPPLASKAFEVCLKIEEIIAARMRPGAIPLELYAEAVQMAEKAGFSEGFMGLGGNKVPFIGHGIGLCIDEWPVLAPRFDSPLQAGMTLALEPKIGLEGIGMVGTENTWEITENGAVCLSGCGQEIICVE